MRRAWGVVVLGLLGLAGCAKPATLSLQQPTRANGGAQVLVAGRATKQSRVAYTAGTAKGHAEVSGGRFRITLPLSLTARTVRVTAGALHKSVRVPAATAIGPYASVAAAYNDTLWETLLSQGERAQLTALNKQAKTIAKASVAKQKAFLKAQKAANAVVAEAKKTAAEKQLPKVLTGTAILTKTAGGRVEATGAAGQLLALSDRVSLTTLATSMGNQAFGRQLGLLTAALGAKSADVSAGLSAADQSRQANTAPKAITSNGVTFNFTYSAKTLTVTATRGQ
ncbi:hypothetical protein [Lacticaseibacillus kribbianus]|uniref:hypothetical protein n=1 Tax=Lacticaseibacillus kribbianus TaxID=2926292 RepID=UPI001CD284C2|nr:hypothetical protein [Lacticaseibacillus kribbianus]